MQVCRWKLLACPPSAPRSLPFPGSRSSPRFRNPRDSSGCFVSEELGRGCRSCLSVSLRVGRRCGVRVQGSRQQRGGGSDPGSFQRGGAGGCAGGSQGDKPRRDTAATTQVRPRVSAHPCRAFPWLPSPAWMTEVPKKSEARPGLEPRPRSSRGSGRAGASIHISLQTWPLWGPRWRAVSSAGPDCWQLRASTSKYFRTQGTLLFPSGPSHWPPFPAQWLGTAESLRQGFVLPSGTS